MATQSLPTKVIAGVTVVDTPIVRAAQEYARAYGDDMAFNHIMRSWIFGTVVYQKFRERGAISEIDLEAHAVSAILHDLGWDSTGALTSPDKRFEVDGAIAARNWIQLQVKNTQAEGWDERRIQLVWDAIALHTTHTIALYKEDVVKICALGIGADFQGTKFDDAGTISPELVQSLNKLYPRLDLIGGIRRIICGFCRTKPSTTYGKPRFRHPCDLLSSCWTNTDTDNFQAEYGRQFVEGYKVEGYRLVDVVENIQEEP